MPFGIDDILMLTGIGSGIKSLFSGGSDSVEMTEDQKQSQKEMNAILQEQKARMMYQTPLYQAVMQLAMGLMPTKYQQGMNNTWGNTPAPGQPGLNTGGSGNPDATTNPTTKTHAPGDQMYPTSTDMLAGVGSLPVWGEERRKRQGLE